MPVAVVLARQQVARMDPPVVHRLAQGQAVVRAAAQLPILVVAAAAAIKAMAAVALALAS